MQNEITTKTAILHDIAIEEAAFVNEECGDTMWDEVLKDREAEVS